LHGECEPTSSGKAFWVQDPHHWGLMESCNIPFALHHWFLKSCYWPQRESMHSLLDLLLKKERKISDQSDMTRRTSVAYGDR
jgi:hypothetical protein